MGMRHEPLELLPGTLDLLILKALNRGPLHGYAIMQSLKDRSDEVLQVGESSLYPALQRLLVNGWVKAEWGASENNRRAPFYTLTRAAAARALGNLTLARENSRAVWLLPWIESLWQDLAYGVRGLRRQPGFTLVAVAALAVAIGLNASLFTVFNAIALRPWPVKDPS